ncbi:MAG TPA: hypothetical protein VGI12_20670 [Vicinamibacterales bacterium]|jgi:hypothetical protein
MTRLRLAFALTVLLVPAAAARQTSTSPTFAAAVGSLSEKGGSFDTDNLISNEGSYLQVIPELRRRNVRGGAYIGVGPDQNFSYIVEVRPDVAYIVDIRRDNVLLHLLFKALFHESPTRVEYLSLLFGRVPPRDPRSWNTASVDRLAEYVPGAPRADAAALHARLDKVVRAFGVPLSADDMKTIAGFHQRFIDAGLALRFQSTGRPPQWGYPTYGDMLVDRDAAGQPAHFLAAEEGYRFLRDLEGRDLVIPVVGDLAGPSAIANIGKAISARGEKLSAFYVSNVEFYLFREGTFGQFVANLKRVPHAGNAVVIRSFFARAPVTPTRPGDNSVSQVASVDDLLRGVDSGRVRSYGDLAGAK